MWPSWVFGIFGARNRLPGIQWAQKEPKRSHCFMTGPNSTELCRALARKTEKGLLVPKGACCILGPADSNRTFSTMRYKKWDVNEMRP